MENGREKFDIFNKLNYVLKKLYYFSPSYFYYMIIDIQKENVKKNCEFRDIKKKISELMKYFFYFIDLVFISFILIINTIKILRSELTYNKFLYVIITSIVIFIMFYCIHKINKNVRNMYIYNNEQDLVDKIIDINNYKNIYMDSKYIKILKKFKVVIISLSLKRTVYIGIFMYFIGILVLKIKCIEVIVALISVFYFIMRPVHYYIVFYKDFKNKLCNRFIYDVDEKIRYITLALSNYIKIILEFCILIYILKYMGWAFNNIEINTFFELVYYVVSGNLEATSSIEMLINLFRISTLGMVISLNLATYMGLEVKKEIDSTVNT